MAQVTSPIILDSTGQQIHSDLQQIKNVLTTPSAAEDITFDNTGTGMQADDVQDAITELKSNLTELSYTSFGTAVNVKSYTSSNKFTIPKDGYIQLSCSTGAGNFCNATIGDSGGLGFSIGCVGSASTYGYFAIFVKKGMLFNVQGGSNHNAYYIPMEQS